MHMCRASSLGRHIPGQYTQTASATTWAAEYEIIVQSWATTCQKMHAACATSCKQGHKQNKQIYIVLFRSQVNTPCTFLSERKMNVYTH